VPFLPHGALPCGEDESMAWRALMRVQEDDMVLSTVLTTASICSKHVRTTTEFPLMSDRVTQFNLTRPVAQRGADGKWSGLTKDMDTGGAHPRHDGTRRSGRSPAFPKAPPPWEAHRGPMCVCVWEGAWGEEEARRQPAIGTDRRGGDVDVTTGKRN